MVEPYAPHIVLELHLRCKESIDLCLVECPECVQLLRDLSQLCLALGIRRCRNECVHRLTRRIVIGEGTARQLCVFPRSRSDFLPLMRADTRCLVVRGALLIVVEARTLREEPPLHRLIEICRARSLLLRDLSRRMENPRIERRLILDVDAELRRDRLQDMCELLAEEDGLDLARDVIDIPAVLCHVTIEIVSGIRRVRPRDRRQAEIVRRVERTPYAPRLTVVHVRNERTDRCRCRKEGDEQDFDTVLLPSLQKHEFHLLLVQVFKLNT